jgi:serine/threonine protein kinase
VCTAGFLSGGTSLSPFLLTDTPPFTTHSGDLCQVLRDRGTKLMAEEAIVDWFVQMCLGLKHIHDRKILHRDLKTSNIFVTRSGMVKIGDFGISKAGEAADVPVPPFPPWPCSHALPIPVGECGVRLVGGLRAALLSPSPPLLPSPSQPILFPCAVPVPCTVPE